MFEEFFFWGGREDIKMITKHPQTDDLKYMLNIIWFEQLLTCVPNCLSKELIFSLCLLENLPKYVFLKKLEFFFCNVD